MVKIPVNLSSEPFRPLRPMLVASVAAGVLLVATLGLLISLSIMQKGQATETARNLDRLQAEMRTMATEQAKLEAVLRKPENEAVLERNQFLNTLLYRKGISWTRIFDDLGKVLPYNVRLISVRPQVNGRNEVTLDMIVGSDSGVPVVDMMKRLENSAQFGGFLVHSSLPPSQTEPLVRYRVTVNYTQKL